ncbi:hypothetical protein ACNHUS_06905 [Actinomycetes bacterium M1A6_2h]
MDRAPFRLLRPPVKVWIDLSALFPDPPHHVDVFTAGGFEVRTVVLGDLLEWSMTTDGVWLGCVRYDLASKERSESVTHWVPSAVLEPYRSDA